MTMGMDASGIRIDKKPIDVKENSYGVSPPKISGVSDQGKLEYEARTMEEEEAAVKQLRKTMVYKANPVPSFYQEGPPPKVELKKIPLTCAKSPNLTRRKSCGDAASPSPEEKGVCTRAFRPSFGSHKGGTATASPIKNKDQISGRNGNVATLKIKDRSKTAKEAAKTSPCKMVKQRSAHISVNG